MQTFVWRDILDKSISGDKIFGGTIDWVDGLYTDLLIVPHTGTSGVCTIDGSGVLIGFNEKIGHLGSDLVASEYYGLIAPLGGYSATMYTQSLQYGVLSLRGAVATEILLTAAPTLLSYHTPKLVLGASTEISALYQNELNGQNWIEEIYSSYLNCVIGYFTGSLSFDDHDAIAREMRELSEPLQALAINLLVGTEDYPVGPGLLEPFATLKARVTAYAADQLYSIDNGGGGPAAGPISNANWAFMAGLDQYVATTSAVQFLDVFITGLYKHSGAAADIDGTQFQRLATIDQDLKKTDSVEFGSILTGSINIGGSSPINQISVYQTGTASVTFKYNGSNYGAVQVDYQLLGDTVTLFIKSEGYDPGHPPDWGDPGHPTDFLIYTAGGTVNSHFELLIQTAFGSILTPDSGAVESATYLTLLKRESSAVWLGKSGVAYMGSDGILRIKKVPTDLGTAAQYYNGTVDPLYRDFNLISTEQILVPKSFSVTYRLV